MVIPTAIPHVNYWGKVNSWKNFRKYSPCALRNVAAFWKSSKTEAFAEKLLLIFLILLCNLQNMLRKTTISNLNTTSSILHRKTKQNKIIWNLSYLCDLQNIHLKNISEMLTLDNLKIRSPFDQKTKKWFTTFPVQLSDILGEWSYFA